MAILPIEIVGIGDIPLDQLTRAIQLTNKIQSEFNFTLLQERDAGEISQYAFSKLMTKDLFALLEEFRLNIRGFHPFIIVITDSSLDSGEVNEPIWEP